MIFLCRLRASYAVISGLVLTLLPTSASAGTLSVTPGSITISADTATLGTFATVADEPILGEGSPGDLAQGATVVITAPPAFRFNTAQNITATIKSGNIDLGAGAGTSITITPAQTAFQFTVANASTKASSIRFSNIQIRPRDCEAAVAGNAADITLAVNTFSATLVDVAISPGVLEHFLVAAEPIFAAAGSPILIRLTAEDGCGNPLPDFVTSKIITITATGGTGLRTFADGTLALLDTDQQDNMAVVPSSTVFDPSGSGTFSVTSAIAEGPINISATDGVHSGNVNVNWVQNSCTLDPPTVSLAVHEEHTVTVLVTNNGAPAVGVPVSFEVTSGPNIGKVGTDTTDAEGEATFTYMSNGTPGTDVITASGNISTVPFSCTSQVVWVNVLCSMDPPSAIMKVGDIRTVTVTVTNEGNPVANAPVLFEVFIGPNSGEIGNGTTNANGQATFTYLGDGGTGVDLIRASTTVNQIGLNCIASVEWITASCSLAPPSAVGLVGTQHSVTVTLLRNGQPTQGTTVLFGISIGPNSGQGAGFLTNAAGQATFSYQSNGTVGVDEIRVVGSLDGVLFECTATMQWSNSLCALNPPTETNQVGTSHTVTLVLTTGGAPAVGVTANFNITAGPNQGATGSDVTDSAGQATFTYTANNTPGTDTIRVSGTVSAAPFQCTAEAVWINASCSLSPPSATHPAGTSQGVTVTVTRNGLAVQAASVDFEVTAGPNIGETTIIATDANGQATFNYTGDGGPGTDTITATSSVNGIPISCSATKTWITSGCALDPPAATAQLNTQHSVTVHVDRSGAPAANIAVSFSVTAGPNQGTTGAGTTNASGSATFSYVGDSGIGTDTITASGTLETIPFSCTASVEWVDLGCDLAPASATSAVGTSHTVTTTVQQGGVDAAGVSVHFAITAGPNIGQSGNIVTNVNGEASFTYTSNGAFGTDTITASGSIEGVPFSCTATKLWVAVACTLSPPSGNSVVFESHTVTINVSRNGGPASGAAIDFEVTNGPNDGEIGSAVTNSGGQATFTYTSNGTPGTDTIEASGAIDGISLSCSATWTWTVQGAVECELMPAEATDEVGQTHTVIILVTSDSHPIRDAVVDFEVTSGPQQGESASAITNAAGMAQFSYVGSDEGTDTITASGSVGGEQFTCTASIEWTAVGDGDGDGDGDGGGQEDNDGVPAATENGAPNDGDGNNDGTSDSEQANVASLPDNGGDYITIIVPSGVILGEVYVAPLSEAIPPQGQDDLQGFVDFPNGFIHFTLDGFPAGKAIDVKIIMHGNASPNIYYKYGATPIVPVNHYYAFLFDGTTGATFSGNTITLHLIDGARGDDDLTANGFIEDIGAPAFETQNPAPILPPPSTCGLCGPGVAGIFPTILGGLWLVRRRRNH